MTSKHEYNILLDIVQRLTRIETKMDEIYKQTYANVADIKVLQTKADVGDLQWRLIKKIFAVSGSSIGIIVTIVTILIKEGMI